MGDKLIPLLYDRKPRDRAVEVFWMRGAGQRPPVCRTRRGEPGDGERTAAPSPCSRGQRSRVKAAILAWWEHDRA